MLLNPASNKTIQPKNTKKKEKEKHYQPDIT
jgi:hypothetical protein